MAELKLTLHSKVLTFVFLKVSFFLKLVPGFIYRTGPRRRYLSPKNPQVFAAIPVGLKFSTASATTILTIIFLHIMKVKK